MATKKKIIVNNQVVEEVANELGLTKSLVNLVVSHQTKYTTEVIKADHYESVRWAYLGIFKVNFKQLSIIKQMKGMGKVDRILLSMKLRKKRNG